MRRLKRVGAFLLKGLARFTALGKQLYNLPLSPPAILTEK
jgi:hypothetical protein